MSMIRKEILIYLFTCLFILTGCKKFLETKSDQRQSVPETLDDLQLLLDNPDLNRAVTLANTGGDEYYVNFVDWQPLGDELKLGYVWDKGLNVYSDWSINYNVVYYANTVLYNLERIDSKDEERKERIKATALFMRSLAFYYLSQLYAPQYDEKTAIGDLGIPLRLNADFNEPSTRASVEQTYEQILQDINTAVQLLPAITSSKTSPSKLACYALLARVYLQMGRYDKAVEAADACLKTETKLINYSQLPASTGNQLGHFNQNPEIIYYIRSSGLNSISSIAKVDTILHSLYESNDLRKTVFFRPNGDGSYAFKGNYSGGSNLFNGLAFDEIILIRAESNARMGNINASLEDINRLLVNRYDNSFVPIGLVSQDQLLTRILEERRKELLYRGTRWSDLKRLNKEPKFATTITRILDNNTFHLGPADNRYTLLIPVEVIRVTNLEQNPR